MKFGLCASLAGLFICAPFFGQQTSEPARSWDVFMNTPEAKRSASKLLGHCGDAGTQDVMNACFAMEFKNADREMDLAYAAIVKRLEKPDQQRVTAAQRAWLKYRDLHCQTVGSLQAGGGSLEPTEVFSCKADLTKARTKEIRIAYGAQDSK